MATGDSGKLHVLFLPYFTPSHMIPLVNAARLFAAQGVKVTIVTTKYNAALFQSSVDQAMELGHEIYVHNLKFPSAEMGIPEGIENFSAATAPEILRRVYMGVFQLQEPMEQLIHDLSPHCIFSDMFYPWTVDLAEKLKIPRILFYPNGFISHCLPYNLEYYEPYKTVKSDSESFLVPGLPDRIEMKRSQLENYLKTETKFGEGIKAIKESEFRSFGMVFDTFYEFEPQYADYYKKDPNKVLYISFGSITKFSNAQLNEIALALEASNQPFIWVVRENEDEQESWLPDSFEERITKESRGLIIRSWAPQLMILNHPAVGGFMTHCGWNSTMEAMTAGVPLITWPLFAEQFYNEKILEVQKVGISVGADHWNLSPVIDGPLVGSKQIKEAINRLMSNSEESQGIRNRAKEVAAMAKRAVEHGGSSYQNLLSLIDDLKSCAFGIKS